MSELGATLLEQSSKTFYELLRKDRKIRSLLARIRDGTSYYDANEYAVRVGELLSKALNQSTDTLSFMSEEVAQELLEPLLREDHSMIATVIGQIQQNMNKANGVGLAPMIPDVDTDRIEGFIKKIASGESLDDVRWMFGEPVINYSQSVVDKGIEANARATSKIGLKAYIIREAEASGHRTIKRGNKSYSYAIPCKWCANLAGKYEYESVRGTGNDVYRRHEACRCRVTYVNGTDRQDVWSKAEWTEQDSHRQNEIIQARQSEIQARKAQEQAQRQRRKETVAYIAVKLGYSDKGASIWLNQNKEYIDKLGIDYMIDQQRNADALVKKKRRG